MRFLPALLAIACALAVAAPARAADSLAPRGAPRYWLPTEPWVLEHWLPYNQDQLLSILGLSLEEVRTYFGGTKYQTVPTLAAVAEREGFDVNRLARRLVNAWHPHVSRAVYAELLNHAVRSLTQGHLMQHMLFHPFHDTALFKASMQVFGVTPRELELAEAQHISRMQLGFEHGRTEQQMISAAMSILRREEAVGVRMHLTPPSEARAELAYQASFLTRWLAGNGTGQQTVFAPPASPPLQVNFSLAQCCCCCCGGSDCGDDGSGC